MSGYGSIQLKTFFEEALSPNLPAILFTVLLSGCRLVVFVTQTLVWLFLQLTRRSVLSIQTIGFHLSLVAYHVYVKPVVPELPAKILRFLAVQPLKTQPPTST